MQGTLGHVSPRSSSALLAGAVLAVVLGLALATAIASSPRTVVGTDPPVPTETAASQTAPDGLPIVALAGLPAEAIETIALITAGGPFPYEQDGATFENRERLLPDRPRGYYREFTVETPGSPDRGPRRIVVGQDGDMYWTADHYDSFAWIAR